MSLYEPCIECGDRIPRNAKGLCSNCVFKKNHGGKSQAEIYSERARERQITKQLTKTNESPITKKKARKFTNPLLRNERLEKRREIIRGDEELYEFIFNSKPHACEECDTKLPDIFRDEEGWVVYRSQYSHILTKAAFPEFRHHKKNMNRLCGKCHDKWEFGDRESMGIYAKNQITIQEIYDDYNAKKNSNSPRQ